MLAQQLEGLGGLGEDADGFGAAHLDWVGVALPGEDVGDPVDGGFEPDGVPGGGSGDDQLQAGFGCAAQPRTNRSAAAAAACCSAPAGSAWRILASSSVCNR